MLVLRNLKVVQCRGDKIDKIDLNNQLKQGTNHKIHLNKDKEGKDRLNALIADKLDIQTKTVLNKEY